MARKIPKLLGLALTGLLKAHGWTAKELAVKAGVSQSAMSSYESGDLARERLDELAALMELGPEEVERAVFAASLLLPPPPPRSPVDPNEEEWRVIQRAAAMAGRDVAERVRDDLLREVREERAALALREGEELYERLKPYSDSARRDLIENAADYQHWGLAVQNGCLASVEARPRFSSPSAIEQISAGCMACFAADGVCFPPKGVFLPVEGVSFSPGGVSSSPKGVSSSPKGVSSSPKGVSFSPKGVSFSWEPVWICAEGVSICAKGVSFPTDGVWISGEQPASPREETPFPLRTTPSRGKETVSLFDGPGIPGCRP